MDSHWPQIALVLALVSVNAVLAGSEMALVTLRDGQLRRLEHTSRGGRVLACGTTVVRVIEDRAADDGRVRPGSGRCGLLIVPGHDFRTVDGLLMNFNLPRTSLLALVAAFAGRARLLAAYAEAVAAGYRFYSYGDAMLIDPDAAPRAGSP